MEANASASGDGMWRISADTGGTFTDIVARAPNGSVCEAKVLSTGVLRLRSAANLDAGIIRIEEEDLPDGFLDGAVISCGARVIEQSGSRVAFDRDLGASGGILEVATGLSAPILGAHWVTGTPLGAKLPPLWLRVATTRGTNALLEGKGAAVDLFVTEGFEDLLDIGDQTRPDLFARRVVKRRGLPCEVRGVPNRIDRRGGEEKRGAGMLPLRCGLDRERSRGRVAVVSLCNGFRNPGAEEGLAEELRRVGWGRAVAASSVSGMPGYLRRTQTAVVEGTLAPVLEEYLAGMNSVEGVRGVEVMNSAGGIVPRERFRAVDSLLSGPAGGVMGAADAARAAGVGPFLAFDMGGTSTDVSRFDGEPAYRGEVTVGPARVFSDALRIDTVAAGGGSVCSFDGYGFTVGPESAGADPGPACYGRGGPLTLTDAHLLLGRIDPGRFRVPVDPGAAQEAFSLLLEEAGRDGATEEEQRAVLEGFLSIANERMAAALRGVSLREGHDPACFDLVSFGGAGGLHACALADLLGSRRILQPGGAGILSARGLDRARPEAMVRRPVLLPLAAFESEAEARFAEAEREARSKLPEEAGSALAVRREAMLRLEGQEATLSCEWSPGVRLDEVFRSRFRGIFGFDPGAVPIEAASIGVRIRKKEEAGESETFARVDAVAAGPGGGFLDAEVLEAGNHGAGPLVIAQRFGTLAVEKGWEFCVGDRGSILLERAAGRTLRGEGSSLPVEVEHELFRRRFDGIVVAMGGQLRRTALSVNIRERLDFSCALLDSRGRLVVNAPHIPVHLGAMGACVRSLSARLDWRPGDVALTNHPGFGGSHLPDLTVVAPVFDKDRLAAFLAVRAHHAELGGVRPGSMPPDAGSLAEEGVVIPPMHLLREGEDAWDAFEGILRGGPHPSRDPGTNRADVLSQVAAVREGARLCGSLLQRFGSERLGFFFDRILSQSEDWAAAAARALPDRCVGAAVEEFLDGGGLIRVRARRSKGGKLVLDFEGSSAGSGSFQCPEGVSMSAVLYILRLLVDRDVPLNEGLLRVADCRFPPGCLLAACFDHPDPARLPPVVAGNVEVSQRLVSALYRLFGLGAGSQATMNNVIFGGDGFSHYETLGGGSGADADGEGASAVQVHMTNTAITDPEILEQRFPVRLERFAVRRGSGGAGRFCGGDGIVREYLFGENVEICLLAQQREQGPPGMAGGEPGLPGRQWIVHPDGRREDLPFACSRRLAAGSRLVVETPGGGGYGCATARNERGAPDSQGG